jgi:hypothetical protein
MLQPEMHHQAPILRIEGLIGCEFHPVETLCPRPTYVDCQRTRLQERVALRRNPLVNPGRPNDARKATIKSRLRADPK